MDSFLSIDYRCIGNYLISISMFTVIQFSRNITSTVKDLMLFMVFPTQLERDLWIENFEFIRIVLFMKRIVLNISDLYPFKDCYLALISKRPSE